MRNTILQIGEIVNTHGLRGEVKIVPWMDAPQDFERLKTVYADIGGQKVTYSVASVKYQKANIIVKFREVPDIEAAQKLKKVILYVDREQLGEPEEGYYICDLLGITVITDTDEILGKITDVFSTGSNDVYTVKRPDGSEVLLPVIDDCILSVDIDEQICRVHLLEGLL